MSKEPTPRVVLQSSFVRDHQWRLSRVIELLEEEFCLRHSPPQSPVPRTVKGRAAASTTTTHTGGQCK